MVPCLGLAACMFDYSQLRGTGVRDGSMPSDTGSVVDARPVVVDLAQVVGKQPPLADAESVLCPVGTYTTESCGTAQCFFALLGAATVGPCLYVTPGADLGVWYVPDCARCPSGVDAAPADAQTLVPDAVPMAPDAAPVVDLTPAGMPDVPLMMDLAREAYTPDTGGADGAGALRDAGPNATPDARTPDVRPGCAAALCTGGGICAGPGPSAGLPCPVLGTNAAACNYCASGVTCLAPSCVSSDPCCGPAPL